MYIGNIWGNIWAALKVATSIHFKWFFSECIHFKVIQTNAGHPVILSYIKRPRISTFKYLKPMDQWKQNFKQRVHYFTMSLLILYDLVTVSRRSVSVTIRTQVYGSPVPDLEILLEVNLNFQVRLTIILACNIPPPPRENGSLLKYNRSGPSLLVISVQFDKEIILK